MKMKREIITVVAVALVAALLFTTYMVFFRDDGLDEATDPFYILSDAAIEALDGIKGKGDIVLHGYDSANDNWLILHQFAEVVADAADFDFEISESPEFNGVEIIYKDGNTRIEYDTFFKTLYNGIPYAFDGESLLVNGILSLAGKDTLTFELRALDGFDTDGNPVTANGAPFMFASVERSQIDLLTIGVRESYRNKNNTETEPENGETSDTSDVSDSSDSSESSDISSDESAESTESSDISLAEESSSVSDSSDVSDNSDASDTSDEAQDESKDESKEESKDETEETDGDEIKFDSYSVYQYEGKFYFDTSIAIAYDEEIFAQVTTNCRYPVTTGKMYMPEGRTWADYGLDVKAPTTAKYTIMTIPDANGEYFIHSVYIGDKASNGVQYYARYIGAVYKKNADGEGELIHNLTKETIFFLAASTVDGSICLPKTDLMKPSVITPITNTQELFSFQDIRIEYLDKELFALAKNMSEFDAAKNLSSFDSSGLTTVISDKKNAEKYSHYSAGWKENKAAFAGFSSSDGKNTYIQASVARVVTGGEYEVRFGLLRDEANGAYLPSKVTLKVSYDGTNWHNVEGGELSPNHSDKNLERYSISFTDPKVVKFIRIGFDVPQLAQTYVVFDEIRIFGDGQDAQPTAAIGGKWKLVLPSQFVPSDRNFAYLDMTNFNDFVQQIASLEGERVVDCGFSDNGNATSTLLKNDILAKWGLDKPARHYSYTYDTLVCDVYVSAKDKDTGKYYAYATYSGEADGKFQVATSDVIVEISAETYPWLAWEFVEFVDHSLLSMYLTDITEMEMTFDGTEYAFDLELDSEDALAKVIYNGKEHDVSSFKYLYQHILSINMHDQYIPAEGDKEPEEYLRIKIHSESTSPEFVFYRVSATRCYFTVDGVGSYYALVEDVDQVRKDILTYVSGGTVTK